MRLFVWTHQRVKNTLDAINWYRQMIKCWIATSAHPTEMIRDRPDQKREINRDTHNDRTIFQTEVIVFHHFFLYTTIQPYLILNTFSIRCYELFDIAYCWSHNFNIVSVDKTELIWSKYSSDLTSKIVFPSPVWGRLRSRVLSAPAGEVVPGT